MKPMVKKTDVLLPEAPEVRVESSALIVPVLCVGWPQNPLADTSQLQTQVYGAFDHKKDPD